MSLRQLFFLVTALLSAAVFVPAAEAIELSGRELLVPVVARTPGAGGSVWRTDLTVTNVWQRNAIDIAISFRQNGESNAQFITARLAPNETLDVKDVLLQTFGRSDAFGYIWIWTNDPNGRLVARARIYNVGSPAGEFGQTAYALDVSNLTQQSFLTGLSGVGGNRTNIGITNRASLPTLANITLIDRHGEQRGQYNISVPAESVYQINDIFAQFSAGPLDGATVRVTTERDTYAYASIVRSDSGDATFVTGTGVRSVEGAPVPFPACENSAPLILSPRPDAGWIISFSQGVDVGAAITFLEQKYGFTAGYRFVNAPAVLVSQLTQAAIAQIRCEPQVAAVEQNSRLPYAF
jgi:hypothetical protein